MKDILKLSYPRRSRVFRQVRRVTNKLQRWGHAPNFSEIYRDNLWGDPESVSGRGSTVARTVNIRNALPELLRNVNARSLLDAPCGDFNWMRLVELVDIRYTGVDVVSEMILRNRELYSGPGKDFQIADVTTDPLPAADAILCRDCFIHLSFKDIDRTLTNFKRSDAKFLFATTHLYTNCNTDIRTGGWRNINLQLPPFNFPQPLESLLENADTGKCLGLWKLSGIEPRRRVTLRTLLKNVGR
ncbi:MAG TPA: class I SAM-dependent methyltransferase [Pyrinomonadaceae bacterium]|nr:class I SAM-dependent methyltransferase [Pyrinomonadaceae bacterium]